MYSKTRSLPLTHPVYTLSPTLNLYENNNKVVRIINPKSNYHNQSINDAKSVFFLCSIKIELNVK